jgi:hypothetical protein
MEKSELNQDFPILFVDGNERVVVAAEVVVGVLLRRTVTRQAVACVQPLRSRCRGRRRCLSILMALTDKRGGRREVLFYLLR